MEGESTIQGSEIDTLNCMKEKDISAENDADSELIKEIGKYKEND